MNNREIKKFKPYTNGVRHRKQVLPTEVTHFDKPFKPLTGNINRKFGKNNQGRKTQRGIIRGAKRLYRFVNFKYNKKHLEEGKVVRIEKDPNRSANIALIKYPNGNFDYKIAANELKIGQKIETNPNKVLINNGNATALKNIPVGNFVFNIELNKGEGAKIVRSAGSCAKIIAHIPSKKRTKILLPSGEIRMFHEECFATIGNVGNKLHSLNILGKAGLNRKLGNSSKVRGSAMSPCSHPHGGGEGKASIGRDPVNKNGKKVFWVTRDKNKFNNSFIVRSARMHRRGNKK